MTSHNVHDDGIATCKAQLDTDAWLSADDIDEFSAFSVCFHT
jgi:hypothetical protein